MPRAGVEPRSDGTGSIAQGGAIEIKGVNGGIKAAPASGGEVEVAGRHDAGGAATRPRSGSTSSSTATA